MRLNTDNKGGMPVRFDQIGELEARIRPFNWHFEWLFPGKDILELMPVLQEDQGAAVDRPLRLSAGEGHA